MRRCRCCGGETPAGALAWRCGYCGSRQWWGDDTGTEETNWPPPVPRFYGHEGEMTAMERALRRLVFAQQRMIHALYVGSPEQETIAREVNEAGDAAGPKAHVE